MARNVKIIRKMVEMKDTEKNRSLEQIGRNPQGFSLIEVMFTIAIVGISTTIAIPSYLSWMPKYKLKGAAQVLYSSMQKAKMAAIKSNTTVSLNFTAGCQGGSYSFPVGGGVHLVSNSMTNQVCISTPTSFPNGFASNGLASSFPPSGVEPQIQLTHPKSNRTYTLTQLIAGGVKLQ